MNPLYPALERLPFSGFQSSLIADRRGSAIWPAIETLQKANRSCGRGRQLRGAMNPLYPALNRLPFSGFQSSLIADRRGSAIRPAIETLQKGKPLLRQGTDGNRSLEGDISLNSLTEAPVVFSAFAVGETPAPERSEGERGGGKTPPCQKP